MAASHYQFGFHNVELFKEDSLGTGSYGGVCKARCDGLLCAAKIMHPTLFDLRDPGTISYLRRFEEECRLLSSAQHPNVVQYLGTCSDPDTRLPVLLMELCDESLCRFLERSPAAVPYHIQVNISHDITLALVYLHLNRLTHRDLTGNNVLMIAGARAKVTDFGMSKLASVNPHTTPMTLCPGNLQYMSPEALEEPPSYTDKLDVFSFGVILVQIMTRLFPDPGPRLKFISVLDFPDGTVRMAVPETERRASHLQLILDTHPLKSIASSCLKCKEIDRPTAHQVSATLCELKQTAEYTESMRQAQTVVVGQGEICNLRSQMRDLQHQVHAQQEEITVREQELWQKAEVVDQKERDIEHLQVELDRMEAEIQQLGQQLQGQRVLTEAKTREVVQLRSTVRGMERELQEKNHTIHTGKQPTSKRNIQPWQQQDITSTRQAQKPPSLDTASDTAAASAPQKDISRLRWTDGKDAPETMRRGSAVVDGNTVYINPGGSNKMYSCRITSVDQQWSTLPDIEFFAPSLAVIDGTLTSVGGKQCFFSSECTNSLLGLSRIRGRMSWSTVFPPMPTARSSTVSVTTQQALIVAGGYDGGNVLDTVEVMDVLTKQWTTAGRLPHPFGAISGTIYEGVLYLAGGFVGLAECSKSVLTCSVSDLLTRSRNKLRSLFQANKTGVWQQAQDLPVAGSTLVSFGGHLLAIGGEANTRNTAPVHCYDTHADLWHVVSEMKSTRYRCLATVLPGEGLFIVGGWDKDTVEIGSLE